MEVLPSDRISNLPDDILQYILSFLPMKTAVSTSILSTRWRYLCSSTHDLDFGEDFGINRKPDEIVSIVGRFLKLHSRRKVERFRLCCHPGENHTSEVENWIEFAVTRGVRDLDLDFSQGYFSLKGNDYDKRPSFKLPSCVYNCGSSLESLKLSLCDFNPPPTFHGFSSLQTLHLIQVNLTKEMVEALLYECPVLENLNMSHNFTIESLKISAPDLPLKYLTIVDCNFWEFEIFAPNLVSFVFGGYAPIWYFKNTPPLVSAYFDYRHAPKPDFGIGWLISGISCVEVLTVCGSFISDLREYEANDGMPVTPFRNLKELQLIMNCTTYEDIADFYSFFRTCPCPSLEKLYIENEGITSNLPNDEDELTIYLQESFDVVFYQLKMIKIKGFRGLESEIQFVKIFLDKAINLELLILITHKSHIEKEIEDPSTQLDEVPLEVLHDQLLLLPKASTNAKIILCEHDTSGLCPTHTKIYEVNY